MSSVFIFVKGNELKNRAPVVAILIKDYPVDIYQTALSSFKVSNKNAGWANEESYQ